MNAIRPAPKARNVIAQAKRGTSAGLGLRPHTNHEPCKGGILRMACGLIPPVAVASLTPAGQPSAGCLRFAPAQGSSQFFEVTQGCARSSLPLGFYIAGPSALRFTAIPAPKARNVIAQAKRGTSAGLGLRPRTNHEPCKGGISRVARGLIPPLQGSSHFFGVTQGCARSSLPLGFYIAGPSALRAATPNTGPSALRDHHGCPVLHNHRGHSALCL